MNNSEAVDIKYMKEALRLAKKGCGFVNPNPMVGAVIVKNGEIIGEGYHECFGELHAERNAFKNCTSSAEGATIYVTLEPCCHYGKTPPCTEAIIKNGISRVVIGALDPNPEVAGKGVKILKDHNIVVEYGILENECIEITKSFRKFITTKRPFITMKYAMTMDGKIATYSGKSKWITGEDARLNVHKSRHANSGIMVGINTVLRDDPMLTCRIENGKNPIRIICDTDLRTPLDSNIVKTAEHVPTIIASCDLSESEKEREDRKFKVNELRKNHCMVITLRDKDGNVDLNHLMEFLGGMNIDSILLEGGGTLNNSALESGIVDRVQAYIAPKIFGGCGCSPVSGKGIESPDDSYRLVNSKVSKIGDDFLIESDVIYPCLQEL